MLQFKNTTPFAGQMAPVPDPDGVDSIYVIVKGTFTLAPSVTVAEPQLPVAIKDVFRGEPGRSSLKVASDFALIKPGTDVLLVGTAHAPGGSPVSHLDVSLKLGPVNKTVRVFGDRVWKAGKFGGARPSAALPWAATPLVWERAFGGTDQAPGEPPEEHAESRNPVGAGFRITAGRKELDGLNLPNLEDPRQLISSWKDRPTPAGFGPLCPQWEPRRTYAGTYDAAWQQGRAPYLPRDFDPRFFQLAPSDQVAPGYLKGDEEAVVVGATPEGELRFRLPGHRVQVTYRLDGTDHARPANLDTVLIEPDEGRLVLVWRTVFACDKKVLRVREVVAALAPGGAGE